jgi:DNA-binding transcriptional MerR regulator
VWIVRTSDIAKAIGVHPNTIRVYEEWGYLPPIPRASNGYRVFTAEHLEQVRLARAALRYPYPGGREILVDLVRRAAKGDLGGALELAYMYLARVRIERVRAEAAIEMLERWAQGTATDATSDLLHIGETAALLDVTVDQLRNWERNGLIQVPRDPGNGYRLYGATEIGRLRVIRMLRQAGYSMMAILRMLLCLDRGETGALRQALDTPGAEEDVLGAADRWLTTLTTSEGRTHGLISRLEEMIRRQ